MRRTSATDAQSRKADLKGSTSILSATDGLPKLKVALTDTGAFLKPLRKQSPQERLRQNASTASSPAQLKLVPRPELTAQEESFYKISRELPPLFERHYQELALDKDEFPLDPDWGRYFGMAATGTLRITTARFGDILAGYIFNLVGPHLHYKSRIHGHIEMYWLDPTYRGGIFSLRWFRKNEDMLREIGVKRVTVDEKHHFKDGRVGLIFRRLGYSAVETTFQKVI